jgi:hypothetical protein
MTLALARRSAAASTCRDRSLFHPVYLHQPFGGCGDDIGKTSEMVNQHLRQRLGVALGNRHESSSSSNS